MIIGLSGKKQSGKTTTANYIADRISSDVIGFFSFPKQIIRRCFGVSGNQDNQSIKEQTLPCGKTVRQLQQYIGTDVFRAIDKNCWINAYKTFVEDSFNSDWPPDVIITPDVRFPNEVECIRELGGVVIRLLRNPCDDQHESETALDDYDNFYCVIDNRDMSIEEQNERVWEIVKDLICE